MLVKSFITSKAFQATKKKQRIDHLLLQMIISINIPGKTIDLRKIETLPKKKEY